MVAVVVAVAVAAPAALIATDTGDVWLRRTGSLRPPGRIVPMAVAPSPQSMVAFKQALVFSLVEPLATVTLSSVPSVPVTLRPVTVTDANAAGAAAQSSAKTAM